MAAHPLKPLRRWLAHPGAIGVGLLLIALMVALHLMSNAVQNSEFLSRAFVPLLTVVLFGLFALALMVGVNVIRLVLNYRHQTVGSRLTARVVLLFALIALLPLGVVYYYSLGFLLRGIDSWFDVEIDSAMEDALKLNRASLDLNQRVLMKYSAQLLAGVEDRSATALTLALDDLRRQAGALELTVFEPNGQVIGTAIDDPTQLVPNHPERKVMQGLRLGADYVGLETSEDGELIVRVLVNDPRSRPLLLQAIFPTSTRISELAAKLEDAYNRYRELSFLRRSLKFSFSLTLSLVLVFGLMAALLAAFATARRLAAPVADIARGTREVAAGNYEQQLPLPAYDDELAFLVASFNAMTRRIAQARDHAASSQRVVEEQRSYLETVLGRLSSGVIAFDDALNLGTLNHASRQILRLPDIGDAQLSLEALEAAHPRLTHWGETVRRRIKAGQEWREEVTLIGNEGRQVLMCRGSPLPSTGAQSVGHVVVFDDITKLIRAQRDAAWGEVARRLAHEIKNPLTPIQLSAERLRHKLLPKLQDMDARLVDRATHTIVQQVEAMKAMVNDFADYARTPQMQDEPFTLDTLVGEVIELYRASAHQIRLNLNAPGALVRGDSKRLRQVVHNLIKNASEALEGRRNGCIQVSTRLIQGDDAPAIELSLEDNGGGIPNELIDRLFEPYVTSKDKGTGLGLSIVKKIIEEHGGIIVADNAEHGARFTARLPVWRADPPVSEPPPRQIGAS
ncbi:MAG: HAMP domain-containing protein [Thiohalocapsa sp. PB-PSB1]|jgi:nitrogen fixation/metabolism regulation signal transduction histidine kinase|nr:MAG: hypothetical protein N838_07225 [Thiohalocapsa sp. PB-PSB1]QQO52706.1 MAG: HAMP domain-containing protein [Thiohalocapsa sp. PB-PSB1]HCS89504.1 HAMP domain-containing histidine kinase [Chromatiaceae bacterium]